ncbi:bifunctional UDP-N-acetylglucosamine diphosphorylase/glucosamine-1-phosphate N-acetyltransferase GlmU [Phytomonospora endophytica]|uniref:Bifunctional protein GlmU n=1 Tax=Phytomonospora endophytica TaxID=714109 RepID=A0A841FTM9_9ACTN|nr:bifunctional UDP-N-acetylglucosamine diphosphorylase/glucosamine-1-phosphate N-acetyltransferase GlmU [Phytomonospora endophytica]MBB6036687.1 bifunctional UDP-N-acetylglucosamine pyrophosphorylase/glucosamine-1-phosphate N-acetyltransferase [Phytomonospora endophytica]GIG66009.1 bifunctional protein GlmU [Phytomonospora endophytica]
MTQPQRTVILLAAGEGKRMKSALPKVLHEILGRSLVGHVLAAAAPLEPAETMVVVGHGADQVTAHLAETTPGARTVLQEQQLGTGHATRVALDALPEATGTVVVLYGDTPLLQASTLRGLCEAHEDGGHAATVLTASVDDPTGLGRIIRDADGAFARIVEQKDATPAQLALTEINSGMYAFDAARLRVALKGLTTDNSQGEEYLTQALTLMLDAGHTVGTHTAPDIADTLGCNDREQLAWLRGLMQKRVNSALMRTGVTMDDPATTWVDVTATVGVDATIRPNVQVKGATRIGEGAEIGPDSTLVDTVVGAGASVVRAHTLGATVGAKATVGPFAYLRPDAELADGAKVGTFVEVKNSTVGAGSKVPHLSYVGDATIGAGANIGAGTIVANYDGVAKHRTQVGDAVFVGSDSVLIAPVSIADGSYVAAGSAVDQNVPSGALGVARGRQRNIEGWVERKRPGTKTAKAAERAADGAAEQRSE